MQKKKKTYVDLIEKEEISLNKFIKNIKFVIKTN